MATKVPQYLSGKSFAKFILDHYHEQIQALKATEGFDPEPYEQHINENDLAPRMGIWWLQPYVEDDLIEYSRAQSKFYGGEMTCAGMLYSPVFGAIQPGNPEEAYQLGYEMSLFDIGYARDLTALVSAMTAEAFAETKQHQNPFSDVIRTCGS